MSEHTESDVLKPEFASLKTNKAEGGMALEAIIDAKTLKLLVTALAGSFEDALLRVGPEGWHLTAVDPGKELLGDWSMPQGSFSRFEAPEQIGFPVDLKGLAKCLTRATNDDEVVLRYTPGTGHLVCSFVTGAGTIPDVVKVFRVPLPRDAQDVLIDSGKETLAIRITTDSVFLPELVKDAKICGKELAFVTSPGMGTSEEDATRFQAIADPAGGIHAEMQYPERMVQDIIVSEPTEPIRGKYNLKHLADCAKMSAVSRFMVLEYSDGGSLRLTWQLVRRVGDTVTDIGEVVYLLGHSTKAPFG